MAAEIPTTEPTEVIAGDTIKFAISLGDYLASDGWVLSYSIRNAADHYDVTGTAFGADHLIEVLASDTAIWAPGEYQYAGYVALGAERYTVRRGTLRVVGNFANLVPHDFRTQARKAVDDLKAALATFKATAGRVKRYSIAGRDVEFETITEMMKLLQFWQREVANEEAADRINSGRPSPLNLQVRL